MLKSLYQPKIITQFLYAGFTSKKYSNEQLLQRLSRQQYYVTQLKGTQPPFRNEYYCEHRKGIYHCIVCHQKLFSSASKYDSGSGWPAFWEKMEGSNIKEIRDESHGMIRTEVQCGQCLSHLGHVFEDGPKDKSGIRYCINSASLDLEFEKQ